MGRDARFAQRERVGVSDCPAPERLSLRQWRYEIAAAYAYHISESQAYVDGNKRTAVQAALDFLEINGIDTSPLPELETYEAMISVAKHEMDREALGELFRRLLTG